MAGQFNKFDDEELEKELALLMGGESTEQNKDNNISLPEIPNVPILPLVPNNKPVISSEVKPEYKGEILTAA